LGGWGPRGQKRARGIFFPNGAGETKGGGPGGGVGAGGEAIVRVVEESKVVFFRGGWGGRARGGRGPASSAESSRAGKPWGNRFGQKGPRAQGGPGELGGPGGEGGAAKIAFTKVFGFRAKKPRGGGGIGVNGGGGGGMGGGKRRRIFFKGAGGARSVPALF